MQNEFYLEDVEFTDARPMKPNTRVDSFSMKSR